MTKNIVILGAGFGGLQAAVALAKKVKNDGLNANYAILLVDRNPYHTFSPLLYEIATTPGRSADSEKLKSLVTYPLTVLLEGLGITFLNDEATFIDMNNRTVQLKHDQISFDYLVIALGAEPNHFDIPGLRENSLKIKTFADAIEIRDVLESMLENSGGLTKVVVAGGGATGVEMAAEIKAWFCNGKNEACKTEVLIVEASPSILGGLDKDVVEIAERRLKNIGVGINAGDPIRKVVPRKLELKSGREIPFDILIWTGGVKPSPLAGDLPIKKDGRGRIEVGEMLACVTENADLRIASRIYAIGDIACFMDQKIGKPVGQFARPAIEEGKIAARNIMNGIRKDVGMGKNDQEIYRPKNYPYIVPIGGKYAVAKFGPVIVAGFLAWAVKGLVELNYLLSIMPVGKSLKIWFDGLRVFLKKDKWI
jgi:NADH:ubiquinone reductase (H+-translocating)